LTVIANAALGACGDSTGVDVELSDAEAVALAEAVVQAAIFATGSGPSQAPAAVGGPQLAPYSSSASVSFAAECPLGGSVDVDGDVQVSGDDATGVSQIELNVTHDHQGCVVETDEGVQFTFDGAPALSFDLVIESDGAGEIGWSGELAGALDWANDEREGRCTIALAFAGLISDVTDVIEVSLEGSVCRRTVSHSVSLGVETPAA
jgi:hypothetical protein